METQKNKLLLLAGLGICAFLAFLLLFKRTAGTSPPMDAILNFGHLPLFGSIALVLLYTLKRVNRFDPNKPYIWAGFITIILGAATECIQRALIPGRSFSLSDIYNDSLGAVTFLTFAYPFSASRARVKLVTRAVCATLTTAVI